jgi:hypothetical protein
VAVVLPEPNYLAPDGVFFLTSSKSIETPDGIERLTPGTRVLRQPDGTYKGPFGRVFKLAGHEVTNDLRVAWDATSADAATQDALRRQFTATVDEAKTVKPAATPAVFRSAPSRSGPAPTPANPLERGAHSRLKAK